MPLLAPLQDSYTVAPGATLFADILTLVGALGALYVCAVRLTALEAPLFKLREPMV